MKPPLSPLSFLPSSGGQPSREYRTGDLRHLAQHHGERTSAQLAQDLGRSAAAVRKFVQRHPEVRKRRP